MGEGPNNVVQYEQVLPDEGQKHGEWKGWAGDGEGGGEGGGGGEEGEEEGGVEAEQEGVGGQAETLAWKRGL